MSVCARCVENDGQLCEHSSSRWLMTAKWRATSSKCGTRQEDCCTFFSYREWTVSERWWEQLKPQSAMRLHSKPHTHSSGQWLIKFTYFAWPIWWRLKIKKNYWANWVDLSLLTFSAHKHTENRVSTKAKSSVDLKWCSLDGTHTCAEKEKDR